MLNSRFWKDKKVFLTGHTGFKGAWLTLWLEHWGATVCGYSLPPECSPNLFEMLFPDRADSMQAQDVRDPEALCESLRSSGAEVVIHLAAQPLVRRSYRDPVRTYETNVMGTVYLLEAIRKTPTVRAAVIVTSDKCYENRERPWGYREDEPMGGHDPYSSSKGCAELVVSAYRRSFFPSDAQGGRVAVASARAGNVIGGGDWSEDRLIPDCIRALTRRRPIPVRNPRSVRPWQHVLEPLGGYLLLAEKLHAGGDMWCGPWNFGPRDDDALPVGSVADLVVKHWGEGEWTAVGGAAAEVSHEANYLKLDCGKARSHLGWTPLLNIEEAIRWTCEWYRHHHDRGDKEMKEFSIRQLGRYVELEAGV
jgi:CDP-glucose 4,6-dehydratase